MVVDFFLPYFSLLSLRVFNIHTLLHQKMWDAISSAPDPLIFISSGPKIFVGPPEIFPDYSVSLVFDCSFYCLNC